MSRFRRPLVVALVMAAGSSLAVATAEAATVRTVVCGRSKNLCSAVVPRHTTTRFVLYTATKKVTSWEVRFPPGYGLVRAWNEGTPYGEYCNSKKTPYFPIQDVRMLGCGTKRTDGRTRLIVVVKAGRRMPSGQHIRMRVNFDS